MIIIDARNVNTAARAFCRALQQFGVRRDSRNGPVTYLPVPVTTLYRAPRERVMWNKRRDANPFFHLMEALWMLSGRRDVAFVKKFAGQIAQYSDDGVTFNGAYGWRWRQHFGHDQIAKIVAALRANPDDRRQVLQMWDGREDLGSSSKDVPCNTSAMFSISPHGAVDMTVTNRSNDAIWGCYGANVVHFSMLQEYVASMLGREVGAYWQVSNNLHVYDFNSHLFETVAAESDSTYDPYVDPSHNGLQPYPMFTRSEDPGAWDQDLAMFMETPNCVGYRHRFFSRIALPMLMAWRCYKEADDPARFGVVSDILLQMPRCDWQEAARLWMSRRKAKHDLKMAARVAEAIAKSSEED